MDRKKLTTFLVMPALLLGGLGAAPQCVGDQTQPRIFDHAPDPRALAEILFPPRYRGAHPGAPGEDAFGMIINFEFDSADIKPESELMLDSVGRMMDLNRVGRRAIVIEGHTDAVGTAGYNQALSERRAGAIKRYLIDRFYIDPERLVVVGKGEHDLHDRDNPEAGVNRRAVFKPLKRLVLK